MKQLAGFDYVETVTAAAGKTVVLFHGYGADCHDLAPLAGVFPPGLAARWVFANAPLTVAIGPHSTGRAWFPIDMAALEAAMMRGGHRDFSGETPPGFLEAAERAAAFVAALGVEPANLVVGGFSQGAMMATELALTMREAPGSLVVLSGALVTKVRWQEALARRGPHLRVFQAHGRGDPVLSFRDAETLQSLLVGAGAKVTWSPFDGGHEIPESVLRGLAGFLAPQA